MVHCVHAMGLPPRTPISRYTGQNAYRKGSGEDPDILQQFITGVRAGAYACNTTEQLQHLFDSVAATVTAPVTTRELFNSVNLIIDRLGCTHTDVFPPAACYDTL